ASFLGWTLDAFDFFLLTFVVTRIATSFERGVADVAFAITLTLMCRPLGALLFGWLADRYGRRTPLMVDIACYSLLELATAFSPNFTVFLVLRALYGVAMGGEWGLGAAMAMEALPPQRRGFFSGLLQEGYMAGYLLAALAYYFVFTFTHWDWRGLFVIGVLPALLIFYIRSKVPESPVWLERRARTVVQGRSFLLRSFAAHWPLVAYAILFMGALNALSHGTQDLYATFLQKQHGFSPGITSSLSIVAAFGAIAGGVVSGTLSQRFGRRATIVACAVLALCLIPLWAFSATVVMLGVGAFTMQFAVQGAWGVIPAHLNELSPADVRATFPGFTYQLGNLLAAGVAQIEAVYAQRFALAGHASNYSAAMAMVTAAVLACVVALTTLGYFVRREGREVSFTLTA
ncbi:MAG: MFS transporter, partial [Candidatus Eremiobacteraeota bacterium]|nr:MFS transporter [Candidatus Eremiobacteraeota bacterium]